MKFVTEDIKSLIFAHKLDQLPINKHLPFLRKKDSLYMVKLLLF